MKPIKEILSDTNSKTQEKLVKAAKKGECEAYLAQLKMEASSASAQDYQNVRILVTDHYLCYYGFFGSLVGGRMEIIPLQQIVNLYRSNMNINNEYDYQSFYLTIELQGGVRKQIANTLRGVKNVMTIFDDVIANVRNKTMNAEG